MPEIFVTYLEMLMPPSVSVMDALPPGMTIQRERLLGPEYIELYKLVGGRVNWDTRLRLSESELGNLVSGGFLDIYTLSENGRRVGICEFELGEMPEIELTNFGIAEHVEGQGVGTELLKRALSDVWRRQPARVWLHTDEWDSPKAVPLYLKVGFKILEQRYEDSTPL
jgi:GNAT superfamily N-acetyltransferase